MLHLPSFIQDLGVILVAAAAVTLLFKWLRQPVVLGYLVAGLLVGPHFPLLPTVIDTPSTQVWAEIGVIFLLFGLGLEFSFKKLVQVGKPASITATVEVLFMLSVGYLTGKVLGWSTMDSVFLGGILSISSTTIIVRAFAELGLRGKSFVKLVFGILIVEDLIAILLLVLLSTIAATQALAGGELLWSGARLAFFLVLWFLVGVYAVPIFLHRIRSFLNNETVLVVSVGLCLSMVILATKAGFSPALGAFVMGSILAETREGARIEHIIEPVRDLFAAVFFVSVGMLLDPKVLAEYGGVVALITFVTILGKFFSTTLGALLSGQSSRHSIQAGMSLAQIGEFSFIIATLGLTLKVTSPFLYPIAVAVSAITTFTTPYLIRESPRFAKWVEEKLPAPLRERLERYETAFEGKGSSDSGAALLWQAYGMKILLNAVVIGAIILGAKKVLLPVFVSQNFDSRWTSLGAGIVALLLSAPFFWGLLFGRPAGGARLPVEIYERLRALQTGVFLFRALVAASLALVLVGQLASIRAASGALLVAVAIGILFFQRFAEPIYQFMEKRFIDNLDEREREELAQVKQRPHLAPWQSTLAEFVLSPESELVGLTLMDAKIRERFGVTFAMIERGKKRILAPRRTDVLMPHDKLFVVGTEEQVIAARKVIEQGENHLEEPPSDFGLTAIKLRTDSPYAGKAIRDSGLREAVSGLIVGIERNGQRILNPDSTLSLSGGDLLWIVGNRSKIQQL